MISEDNYKVYIENQMLFQCDMIARLKKQVDSLQRKKKTIKKKTIDNKGVSL